jgi:hypothetical protein
MLHAAGGLLRSTKRLELLAQLAAHVWRHPGAHLAGATELAPVVVADDQRIDGMIGRSVTTDHELLLGSGLVSVR